MKEIRRQIKEHTFYKVYLLTGDEEYLVLQAKNMLCGAMISEGDAMNYAAFEETKVDLAQLRDLAQTFPFFAEKRMLLLDRTGILKSGKEELPALLSSLPDTTCMVICEPEVDKRTKVYKWIKKNGYVGEFLKKNQTQKVLLRWIATLLGKEKKQIREKDAAYFLQKTGNDMFQIKQEADKLISFVGERGEITREDIDQITSEEIQDKIFDLTAAIAQGDKEQAMNYYNDLILRKEAPMHILYLLVRQYRILLVIYDMRRQHKPEEQMAQAAGIPKFFLRKYEQQLRGYDALWLEEIIEECIEIEEEIKTGKMGDQMGIEVLLVRLSEKIKKI